MALKNGKTMLQAFEGKLKQELQAFFDKNVKDNPAFKLPDGTIGGFYAAGLYTHKSGGQVTLWITVASFAKGYFQKNITIPSSERGNGNALLNAAETFFKQNRLTDSKAALSQDAFNHVLLAKIARAKKKRATEFHPLSDQQADEAQLPRNAVGLYQATIRLPSPGDKNNSNIAVRFTLRPIADYLSAGTTYAGDGAHMNVSTQCLNMETAKALLQNAKPLLEEQGLFEYNLNKLGAAHKVDKIIPPAWVILDEIRILRESNSPSYYLFLVNRSNSRPVISLSLCTGDSGKAEKMLALAKAALSPGGELHGKDITLKSVGEYIFARIPPDEIKSRIPRRFDRRQIKVGNKTTLQLYTPNLEHIERADGTLHHEYVLRVAPPPGPRVNACSDKTIKSDLNTADPAMAIQRLATLQNLAEIALTDYCRTHPDMTIPTETKIKRVGGVIQDTLCFRDAKPGERTGENEIFFDNLKKEVIDPALKDFDRYIYWQTEVKRKDDKWEIRCEARRNNGEPMAPDTSIFSGPFTIAAPSEEAARAFAHTLELAILGQQQELYSRQREVQQFGEASTDLVIRESLLKALLEHKEAIDLNGNNLLTQLMRSPPLPNH